MAEDKLLVTFRSSVGRDPCPRCALRLQIDDDAEADRIERFLADGVEAQLDLHTRALPRGVCFEIHGAYHSLLSFLGLDESLEKATSFASKSFKDWLQEKARTAIARWHRRDFELELPRDRRLVLGDVPAILGILNVTPDSFSDGNEFLDPGAAIEHALAMVEAGADAIDVGGESTRPGAARVSPDEELRRVAPVIAGIRKQSDVPLSIDTSKEAVARAALDEGADIVNDVTAFAGDAAMLNLVAERRVPAILMHMRGTPETMQNEPCYDDAVAEIAAYLWKRLREIEGAGLDRSQMLVDPGIGFGKRPEDNLDIVSDLNEFRSLGSPVLIGLSRKSFLGKGTMAEREAATLVANTISALGGAACVRVHQVANAREMKNLLAALATRREQD